MARIFHAFTCVKQKLKKMKSIVAAGFACLLVNFVFAQADTAEKKMTPPEIRSDTTVIKQNKVNDTLRYDKSAPPDKTSVDMQDKKTDKNPQSAIASTEGVLYKDGVMTVIRNGKQFKVDKGVLLENGNQVSSDGTMTRKDGKVIKLTNGVLYDFSGNPKSTLGKLPSDQRSAPENKTKTATQDKNMYLVPDSSVRKYQKDSLPK
jgi:hypothetical protein